MFLSDLIQSIAAIIQARWAFLGGIENDYICWAQAVMVCFLNRLEYNNNASFKITFGDVATAGW